MMITAIELAREFARCRSAQREVRFAEIDGWPGYRIGDDGSFWTRRTNSGRLVEEWTLKRPTRRKSGHLFVTMWQRPKCKCVGIHTLVLTAFTGPRPPGLWCRHLDGDPANNHHENLAWGTPKENGEDTVRHGTQIRGIHHPSAKLDVSQVLEIRRRFAEGATKKGLAREYGVRDYTIQLIVERRTWTHV